MAEISNVPIYIIDDDENIVLIVRKALEMNGYMDIQVATCGKDAEALLKLPSGAVKNNDTVQLAGLKVIILDIMLPDINGFELCRQIKDKFHDSLVVLISGFSIDDLHQRIMESDADDFLTKPFSPIELVARIDLLIKKYIHYSVAFKETPKLAQADGRNSVPHIGDSVDEFQIIDSLGWGRSSIVYKVIEKKSKKAFAAKLLTRYAMDMDEVVERFEHEVSIMARLQHPNIIRFYRMGNYNGCPYILMDYVYGINLEEFIITKGRPNLKTLINVMEQTASAISEIHAHGIIHRDIKPKNLMIELGSGNVKLTDFGIAVFTTEDPSITRDGFIVGTPLYMAPELFSGGAASVASDIYSFGVAFFQFASGAPPFTARTNTELFNLHKNKEPEPISSFVKDIPIELEKLIIGKCMRKLSSDRPSSMNDVLQEIKNIRKKYIKE
ncbi:MAG: hypothetical protein A2020_06490 [Lentisphaerae bacterium GWF2_45_14]|nr:MAG: hypothetical protein A2020_06490 [Lentisphaerae bacterium GWF2_45_14]